MTRQLAGPSYRNPLGAFLPYRKDPLTLFYEQANTYNGSVRLRLAYEQLHLLVDEEHIRQVLVTNFDKYAKGISYNSLNYLLGPGLLTSDGKLWKTQRALIKPAFTRRHVTDEIPIMVDAGERMYKRLDHFAANGSTFDLVTEVLNFAADVVCRAVMGSDVEDVLPQIDHDVRDGVAWVMRHMSSVVQLPPSVPTPNNRRFQALRARLNKVVDDVIAGHKKLGDDNSLLGRLVKARDDTGHAMDNEQLRHEVLTFLLAGHETTGGAIAWTMYELCRNPAVLHDVVDEVDSVLRGDLPAAELLPALDLTGRAIDESMRLHPPAWAFSRSALESDAFNTFDIDKGAIIVISPFVNQRLPQFWSSPLQFDPGRFTPEASKGRSPFHYFPFGWGPHLCVGQHLALTEIRVGLAMLLARYEFELVNGMRVRENPEISNLPDPVICKVRQRA
ncbi:cytochrome P450 [Mycobacteroides stephanolepidis]|uniref:Cytochrome P450 n=1 Tax=[Mycobacterium] stephanolepidis TaxID=1520670 RepID=A0A1Z4F0H3_9MYCO|nr:cytochrome P450 [[Mycobacterium] stephanolepidis]BAX98694.1 cytochrome P450 [[Mycobacterium] stephanolepidis]